MRETMTVTQASEVLGISRCTAYEAVRSGQIPSIRFGKRILVPRHAIDVMLGKGRGGDQPISARPEVR
mgnify:CR=1 FL=1